MNSITQAPAPMQKWLSELPNENAGTLYAKIKAPFWPIYTWHKVPVWGQICDGQAHEDAVGSMLYNEFPNHGKGFTYVAWRAEPDHPEANKYPRQGKIKNPKPFAGKYGK